MGKCIQYIIERRFSRVLQGKGSENENKTKIHGMGEEHIDLRYG
jgi:hypothetical protein